MASGIIGVIVYLAGVAKEKKVDKHEAGLLALDFGIDALLFYSYKN